MHYDNKMKNSYFKPGGTCATAGGTMTESYRVE